MGANGFANSSAHYITVSNNQYQNTNVLAALK